MRYDSEVREHIGSAGEYGKYDVVIYEPHNDMEFVCIGFDTPDERRWDLDAEEAQDLSALLSAAAAALTARKSAAGS